MSDIGLYSTWYERIRAIAELVDETLLEVRSESSQRRGLIALRNILAESGTAATLARQVLTTLLGDSGAHLSLASLEHDLSGQTVPATALGHLEQLAEILEEERARAVAQLRK